MLSALDLRDAATSRILDWGGVGGLWPGVLPTGAKKLGQQSWPKETPTFIAAVVSVDMLIQSREKEQKE